MNADKPLLLAIDDDTYILKLFEVVFGYAGFEVSSARTCDDADHLVSSRVPNVILVDWNLPGMSGVQYIKRLRSSHKTSALPIVMVSARSSEHDIVEALESGADDYVKKPFSNRELVGRLNAVMRGRKPRAAKPASTRQPTRLGRLEICTDTHRCTCNGVELELGPAEYRLLRVLAENPGRIFSRVQLLQCLWPDPQGIEPRTVDVHISRLRRRLAQVHWDRNLETIRGEGYRVQLKADPRPDASLA
jgi:two-component system, OmpR family, phosphate regulon response regulator PhoB